jgi:hypothetical protein
VVLDTGRSPLRNVQFSWRRFSTAAVAWRRVTFVNREIDSASTPSHQSPRLHAFSVLLAPPMPLLSCPPGHERLGEESDDKRCVSGAV